MALAGCVATALVLVLIGAQPVRAQAPDASVDHDVIGVDPAFEAHVGAAVAAYEAREPARALASFRRAFEIAPTPRVLRGIAMCEIELGRFADAHRSLVAALASDRANPVLGEALRTNIEGELLPLVRSRVALWLLPEGVHVSVDGRALEPDDHRVVAVDAGRREVVATAQDGRSTTTTVDVSAGHVGPLPIALPDLPSPPPPAASRVVVIEAGAAALATVVAPRPSTVSLAQREGLDDPVRRPVRTRFSGWAHGTIGAWQGGAEYSPAATFGLTAALMTYFLRDLAIGGQLDGTWAGLLDTCGPYVAGTTIVRTSETCGWFRMSARLAIEIRAPGSPIAFLLAVGPGIAFRGTQQLGESDAYAQSSRADGFFAVDGGLRFYLIDDLLFAGVDVRSAIGAHADVGGGILVGAQVP